LPVSPPIFSPSIYGLLERCSVPPVARNQRNMSLCEPRAAKLVQRYGKMCGIKGKCGGEAGIRTLDTGFGPYNGLANRRLQPLGHLTARLQVYGSTTLTRNRRRALNGGASRVQTAAFVANCNCGRALARRSTNHLGTVAKGTALGTVRRDRRSVRSKPRRKLEKATVSLTVARFFFSFNESNGRRRPWASLSHVERSAKVARRNSEWCCAVCVVSVASVPSPRHAHRAWRTSTTTAVPYCCRSATSGSSVVARRAGR
jgi:hypothetical protein